MDIKKFFKSFTHAFRGIILTLKEHQNLKFHYIAGTFALILAYIFKITIAELTVLLTAIFFVIFAEMLNTAIEEACNAVTEEVHPKIKNAKDVAAGAVLITSVFAAIVGVIIFLPYFTKLLS